MAEFHVGDKVRFTGPFSWMKGFTVTEIHPDGEHYTGEERAWWPEEVLDYEVTDEKKEVALELERAFHEYGVAHKSLGEQLKKAREVLPLSLIAQIQRAAADTA